MTNKEILDLLDSMKKDGIEATPTDILLGVGLANFIWDSIVEKNSEEPKTYETTEWEENK